MVEIIEFNEDCKGIQLTIEEYSPIEKIKDTIAEYHDNGRDPTIITCDKSFYDDLIVECNELVSSINFDGTEDMRVWGVVITLGDIDGDIEVTEYETYI